MITRAAMAKPTAAPRAAHIALVAVLAIVRARAIPARPRGAAPIATLALLSAGGGAVVPPV